MSSIYLHGDGTGSVFTECPFCRGLGELVVDVAAYESWQAGTLLQDAFPTMRPQYREQIKSGIHPECWREMFGPAPWETRLDRVKYRVRERLEPIAYRMERFTWRLRKRARVQVPPTFWN